MRTEKPSLLVRGCRGYVLAVLGLVVARGCVLTTVEPGYVGVRYNNALGLLEEDLKPGWHLEIAGLHRVWKLPAHYLFLDYRDLNIRTKDNNTVTVDVSVPYRVTPEKAWEVMAAGNHLSDGDRFRFERLAYDTTIGVLREHLAELQSSDFYNTERRLEVAAATLAKLNQKLTPLNLHATDVLIRQAGFRPDYERQLAAIQLNEQQKLLDGAREVAANKQQTLDNFQQRTQAMANARHQDWQRRIADVDRAYQVGFLDIGEDQTPGAVRRKLNAMTDAEKQTLFATAAHIFETEVEKLTEDHLLGIKNIEAETLEYIRRVRSHAEGISARLAAEGDAMVAQVKGAYEARLNALLDSPGGRAYVAWKVAGTLKFDETLTFRSSDGVPSVLRLRDFALQFMGQ